MNEALPIHEKHEILLRIRAIELLAYWEGRLVTNRLVNWFGISRQQASSDIKRYLTDFNPNSLIHDPSVKAYVPQPGFQPVLTTGHINEYLDFISGLVSGSSSLVSQPEPNMSSVQLPDRSVRPEVLREVIRASRANGSLKIRYASMANPTWSERTISPHNLVYTGFRWHVRAYCHLRRDFRDFLLSRIDRIPKIDKITAPNSSADTEWNEMVTITLVANEKLTEQQKALVEKDFVMQDGRLRLPVRKALVHYTLQRYQAAISEDEANDAYKFPLQLLCTDREKLKRTLFRAEQK
jgi:predicted DNA-binding transcriptional regulator YafY